MGDHDDNHNHGHKKGGDTALRKNYNEKKREQTNITKIRTSIGRQGQGQGRRWQEGGQVERWKDKGPDVVGQARQVLSQQLSASCLFPF